MKFLTENDVKREVTRQLQAGSKLKAAVAFWGSGAGETLQLLDHRERVKIVCNLKMGGTNPSEIEALLDEGITITQRADLHAKVYLFDKAAIVGSSNASSSGLSYQDTDNLSWREANILVTDASTLKEIATWIQHIFENSEPIKKVDITKAKELWRRRRALNPLHNFSGKTLLDVAKENPYLFEDKGVFVSCSLEHSSKAAFQTMKNVRKDAGLDVNSDALNFYEDWDDIPTSSLIVDFFFEKGKASFEGFWKTPDEIVSIPVKNGNGSIQLINKASSVHGLSLGSKKAWFAAVEKAMPIFEKGEIISLDEFANKYL